MLGKNKKNMDWKRMPAVDRTYLIAAYNRYESLRTSSDLARLKTDNFQDWLLKRGIRKQVSSTAIRISN